MTAALPWTENRDDGSLSFVVNSELYADDVVARACYAFSDRCYAHFTRNGETIRVSLASIDGQAVARELAGEFSNALIEQALRARIAGETRSIRELIVAQAFCEGDLLDRSDSEAGFERDPRGIRTTR